MVVPLFRVTVGTVEVSTAPGYPRACPGERSVMASIRLVATDLDGTLLRSDRTISERTAAAMATLRDSGIELVWATARARHSVHESRCLRIPRQGDLRQRRGSRGPGRRNPQVLRTHAISPAAARAAIDWLRTLTPGVAVAAVGPNTFVAETAYANLCVFADHHREPATMDRSATPSPPPIGSSRSSPATPRSPASTSTGRRRPPDSTDWG